MLNDTHTLRNSFVFLLLIGLGGTTALAGFGNVNLTKLSIDEVGRLFLTALFAALVIERAVEVWINYRFDPVKRDLQKGVFLAEQRIVAFQKDIEDLNGVRKPGDPMTQELIAVTKQLQNAREEKTQEEHLINEQLRNHLDYKTRSAQFLALIFSGAAAAFGIRIFEQFSPDGFKDAVGETQFILFQSADVVLTTLLLAGGADGIHKIIGPFLKMKDDVTK